MPGSGAGGKGLAIKKEKKKFEYFFYFVAFFNLTTYLHFPYWGIWSQFFSIDVIPNLGVLFEACDCFERFVAHFTRVGIPRLRIQDTGFMPQTF